MKDNSDDVKAVENLGEARDGVVKELRKVIVGMEDVIDESRLGFRNQESGMG